MSLYKDASLVMIPTAYKDGKLYSIRPVPEYGSETIINGSFDADSDWSKGTGWTISGGTASCDGTQTGTTNLNNTAGNGLLNGKTYRVVYTISGYAGGSISIKLGNTGYGVYHSANGTYTQDLVAGVTTFPTAQLNADANFIGSIDNVSVQEIVSSGDFDFSRGSNLAATRVDVNGLIEKGRENLLPYSNDLNGSDWSATRLFSTTNGHSGYDGSNDAWLVIPNSSNNTHYANQVITSGNGVQTISVYAKASGYDYFSIRDGSASDTYGLFDLATQTTSTDGSNAIESKMVSVGNDWYRCSLTLNRTAGGSNNLIFYVNNVYSNKPAYVGDEVSGVYFQDFQLEQGLVATDVISTTTTSVSAGILEDMPRLDYSGGASCPSLLLEPQRTNSLTYSEYFGDSSWNNSNAVTRSISSISSPEGKLNAYDIIPTTANTNHTLRAPNLSGFTSGAVVNVSFFAKANGYKFISVVGGFGSSSTPSVVFNLESGTIVSGTGTMEDYGDGWWRCVAPITLNATALYCVGTILNDSQSGSFAGDGTSAISVYGFQAEQGSYHTAYIPCMGTSQTRSTDNIAQLDLRPANLTGDKFTYMLDITLNTAIATFSGYFNEVDSVGNYKAGFVYSNGLQWRTPVATINQYITLDSQIAVGDRAKMLVVVDGIVRKVFYNGSLITTLDNCDNNGADTDAIIPYYGSSNAQFFSPSYNQILVFDTALTDSECIALTTL
jgi:hypothetical protein